MRATVPACWASAATGRRAQRGRASCGAGGARLSPPHPYPCFRPSARERVHSRLPSGCAVGSFRAPVLLLWSRPRATEDGKPAETLLCPRAGCCREYPLRRYRYETLRQIGWPPFQRLATWLGWTWVRVDPGAGWGCSASSIVCSLECRVSCRFETGSDCGLVQPRMSIVRRSVASFLLFGRVWNTMNCAPGFAAL